MADDKKTAGDITGSVQPESAESDFVALGNVYTKALGTYSEWATDIDLGPVDENVQVPAEDSAIFDYYNSLQYSLYETGYPETEDRTGTPRTNFTGHDVTITVLSSPVECMAIVLEGGRQCPENMLLVLSLSWVSKVKSERSGSLYSLFVHKAISFGRGGNSYLDVFDPPRRTTYLVNFFTYACTGGHRCDGEELERNLDCPMSSSIKLAKLTDDKLRTRCIMGEVGMAYPETLAFSYQSEVEYLTKDKYISVRRLESKSGVENLILDEVTKFLQQPYMRNKEKVVVKPSGSRWYGSVGVSFHRVTEVTSVTIAVMSLVSDLEPGDAVLVETFCPTVSPLKKDDKKLWYISGELGFRARATVCRTPDDEAVCNTVICGVQTLAKPICGDNTVPQTLDSTLKAYGFEANERKCLRNEVITKSEAVLRYMIAEEKQMSQYERGEVAAQTDVIGIDVVITPMKGSPAVVGIEVNSHDCTINCQIFEFMNPHLQGASLHHLVQTMISRSLRDVISGKRILVVGAGGYSKRDIWPEAAGYGLNIVLVDDHLNHFAKDQVSQFIYYDFADHSLDRVHAHNIVAILEENLIHIDGCLTIWEDCGPLAATICQILNLNGPGLQAAKIGKTKSWTQSVLRSRTGDIPHWPRTALYTSPVHPIHQESDISTVPSDFRFPAVLKLEYGSSAVGVTVISCRDDLLKNYLNTANTLQTERDFPGIGLGHGNDMLLMEYIEGSEHDVDVVVYKRQLVAAFISDNGPTRDGVCMTETTATMPTHLPTDKQSQLIASAYQCCTEIGLTSGVFNVELKMTPIGPKLLEINARMGGFYNRTWIRKCYGVDLMLCACLIACGIRPYIARCEPRCSIAGVMCIPSLHGHVLEDPLTRNKLHSLTEKHEAIVVQFEQHVPRPNGAFEEPIANVAVISRDLDSAKQKLIAVCRDLNIESEVYPVADMLADF